MSTPLSAAAALTEPDDLCGESPLWDDARQRLLWVDIGRRLVRTSDSPEPLLRDVASSALAWGENGDLLIGGDDGLWCRRGASGRLHHVAAQAGDLRLAINDMLPSPGGGLYLGTAFWEGSVRVAPGTLWLWRADAPLQPLDDGFELANGMALAPDGRTLYVTDSTARTIWQYDVAADDTLSGRRLFARVPGDEGLPDGLTSDSTGHLWSARWYGGSVGRYDPDGRLVTTVPIPALQVSSVAFGGARREELFVTTAADPWDSPYVPTGCNVASTPRDQLGGRVYRLHPGVTGVPDRRVRTSGIDQDP